MADDNLKDQRAAFEFLREKFRTQDAFTKGELQQQTSWDWKSTTTYWSKQFEPFVKPVAPILKGAAQKKNRNSASRGRSSLSARGRSSAATSARSAG